MSMELYSSLEKTTELKSKEFFMEFLNSMLKAHQLDLGTMRSPIFPQLVSLTPQEWITKYVLFGTVKSASEDLATLHQTHPNCSKLSLKDFYLDYVVPTARSQKLDLNTMESITHPEFSQLSQKEWALMYVVPELEALDVSEMFYSHPCCNNTSHSDLYLKYILPTAERQQLVLNTMQSEIHPELSQLTFVDWFQKYILPQLDSLDVHRLENITKSLAI